MKLTRREAIDYQRKMWTDMQKGLGDNPSFIHKITFEEKWLQEHFPNDTIETNCFLCEYAKNVDPDANLKCKDVCPIDWKGSKGDNELCAKYYDSPISVILVLPEKEAYNFHDYVCGTTGLTCSGCSLFCEHRREKGIE